MTSMTQKRKRRGKLIIILIVLSNLVESVALEALQDNALTDVYNNDYEEQLNSAEMAATQAVDEMYLNFDPNDEPDNFDEYGTLPEVDVESGGTKIQNAVEELNA